jgi:hypothetical protein
MAIDLSRPEAKPMGRIDSEKIDAAPEDDIANHEA